ncbi:MAG TPA: preprotein translocase subunit SecE [Candidatus Limosilactobacillus merdigallinarum]|uniref:Protein translocase subunit SecE n=2 Tax=Limosilactobacillus TaxID=2742598 RepID=C7XWD6_9LACO|nr:preprotein translocase subunit SecE [Limosilactobacillus coleohominis]EEU30196.1 preprotein translocase, SecE subunit [Limosilactobacillus coleohominis 101-4-CHN]HIX36012.1 preprotein translocase subunit SecE [Candidatus Limosilactobacillus merdigallinarum]HJA46865.1 preprotein translocase subunit SecE [Candidatus Limosilactobacillus excrementigallinarum]
MHLFRFLKSVVQEMHKVVWPTWKENRRDTGVVISLTIFFVIFFALADWIIQAGMLAFVK